MKASFSLLAVTFFLLPVLSHANMLVGGDSVYTVRKGDSMELIGSRLGISWKRIMRENRLDPQKPLKKGMTLRVNTRRIVPTVLDNGIIVNIPDKTLYFMKDGQVESLFPVALGMVPRKDSSDWTTPLGKFRVLMKQKYPSWYVPKSIQTKMEEEGKPVETIVSPGPDNPLGRYAIKTSLPGILIHETISPWSVFHFRSHGCIRVMPEHMEGFFGKVAVNTPGQVIYKPIKIALSEAGRIFIEIHGDPYKKVRDLKAAVKAEVDQYGLSDSVDWQKIGEAMKEKSGIPQDITADHNKTYQSRRELHGQRRTD